MAAQISNTPIASPVELIAPKTTATAQPSQKTTAFKSELDNVAANSQAKHRVSSNSLKNNENEQASDASSSAGNNKNASAEKSSTSISASDTNEYRHEKNVANKHSDTQTAQVDSNQNPLASQTTAQDLSSTEGKALPENGESLPQTLNIAKNELASVQSQAAQASPDAIVSETATKAASTETLAAVTAPAAASSPADTANNSANKASEAALAATTVTSQISTSELNNSIAGNSAGNTAAENNLDAQVKPVSVQSKVAVETAAAAQNTAQGVQATATDNRETKAASTATPVSDIDTKVASAAAGGSDNLATNNQQKVAAPVSSSVANGSSLASDSLQQATTQSSPNTAELKSAISGASEADLANKSAQVTPSLNADNGASKLTADSGSEGASKAATGDSLEKPSASLLSQSVLESISAKVSSAAQTQAELNANQHLAGLEKAASEAKSGLAAAVAPVNVSNQEKVSDRALKENVVNINALDKSLAVASSASAKVDDKGVGVTAFQPATNSAQAGAANLLPTSPQTATVSDNQNILLNQSLDKLRSGVESALENKSDAAQNTAAHKETGKASASTEVLQQLSNLQNNLRTNSPVQLQIPAGTTPEAKNWGKAVADKVMIAASQNLRVAHIQLDPPELGALQVRLQVSSVDQQMSVSFTSPHASVRDALEQQLPRLREMLENQGINLGESSVNDQNTGSEQNSEDQHRGRSSNYVNKDDATLQNPLNTQGTLSLVDFYA